MSDAHESVEQSRRAAVEDANWFLDQARSVIDRKFGPNTADSQPGLVSAFMQTASVAFLARAYGYSLRHIADEIGSAGERK